MLRKSFNAIIAFFKNKKEKEEMNKQEDTVVEDLTDELCEPEELKQPIYIINNMGNDDGKDNIRTINCYGDITERLAGDVVQAMLYFDHTKVEVVEAEDGTVSEIVKPFKMYISTHGGVVSDMFSILDVMDMVKRECDIETVGIGKVMSAGVLMLASGTKGMRKIGRNCRVMLHSVISGHHGSFPNVENEMRETKALQDMYFDYLCERTKLTRKKLKKLLLNNVDVYLSAEEAIKYGIADDYL